MIGLANIGSIALGLIMIGIVIFEPLGMFGIWIRMKKYWMTGPSKPGRKRMVGFE